MPPGVGEGLKCPKWPFRFSRTHQQPGRDAGGDDHAWRGVGGAPHLPGPREYLEKLFEPDEPNRLFYGDNLDVLRQHVKDESVSLVYLDPPFKSDQDYNVLFAEHGTKAAAQIKAFEDTWTWDIAAEAQYVEMVERGGEVAKALKALRDLLGNSDMMAYLAMMAPRLAELHRVLKPGGSLYLHCDPTASHYLKLLLDATFRPTSFQNEIIWSYRRWPSPSKHYQRMHDVILFYAKGHTPATFNVEYEENSPSYQKRFGGKTQMLDPESRRR